jgi:hypothetical protein
LFVWIGVADTNLRHRGEQAATALETNLTSLERKLDAMLAAFEAAAAAQNKPQKDEMNGADK